MMISESPAGPGLPFTLGTVAAGAARPPPIRPPRDLEGGGNFRSRRPPRRRRTSSCGSRTGYRRRDDGGGRLYSLGPIEAWPPPVVHVLLGAGPSGDAGWEGTTCCRTGRVIHSYCRCRTSCVLCPDQLFAQAAIRPTGGCGSHPHRYSHSSGGHRPGRLERLVALASIHLRFGRIAQIMARAFGYLAKLGRWHPALFPGGRSRCPGGCGSEADLVHDGALIPVARPHKPIHAAGAQAHHLRRR